MPTEKDTSGMFPRGVDARLLAWMNANGRKPLILRGARQVGKTVAVRLFARHFDQFVDLNMDLAADADLFRYGVKDTLRTTNMAGGAHTDMNFMTSPGNEAE